MDKLIKLYLFKRNDYDTIKQFIKDNVEGYEWFEDDYGNMYGVFPGSDCKCCIAAHLDQVEAGDIEAVLECDDYLFGEDKSGHPANLGADDKNGVWVAMEAAKHERHPKLAFFVDEETGRNGSKACAPEFFDDVACTIVVDRRGSKEIIYEGRNRQYGSLLHILFKAVNPDWRYEVGISCDADSIRKYCDCINISCGCYKCHTRQEYTCLAELQDCLEAVNRFLDSKYDLMPIFDHIKEFRWDVWSGDDSYMVSSERV